ncbi:RibD family protein [uncultured Winogradskyella sp.]|uniref:RibD family protein n=1 Tax=uncultured Winogradskyella sp. TaxID=395353 RepID=UPI0026322ED7|nr:RibD family protein [uncultured Winogradskyella sp.]
MKVDDTLWQKLLELKNKTITKNILGWAFNGKSFSEIYSIVNLNTNYTAILLKSNSELSENTNLSSYRRIKIPFEGLLFFVYTNISSELLAVLQNYWPLSVLCHLNTNLPYIFIHSATSLDGYLATTSGSSQWIGNDENLIHAHRLRALFDSVLVGGKTVLNDKPSLNVRHVKGDNPKRLILSNKCKNLSSLKKIANCKTYLLRDLEYSYDDYTNHFDKIISFKGKSKKDKILDLLQKCKDENITSILIEGGGTTLSTFIETKFAKTIQFHISPMLFGSGIKAVKLPAVNLVNETHKLKNMYVTQIGNSFMITAGLV